MSEQKQTQQMRDYVLPFQVGDHAIRGQVVCLDAVAETILSRHQFPDPLSTLVGEAAALVSMLGAALKFDGRFILQAQGDGPVSMIVADYATTNRAVRATAKITSGKEDKLAKAKGPDFLHLLGKGHLCMSIDRGPDFDLYQGITDLRGATLSEAAIQYFTQSEQIPTMIRLAVGKLSLPGEDMRWRAGGILVQFIPAEGGSRDRGEAELQKQDDKEAWARAEAFVASVAADELLDPSLPSEDLLYRLFHEDGVRVFDKTPIGFDCTCSREKIAGVLERYSDHDLKDMVEDGHIAVTCDFCREKYKFPVKS